LSALVRVCPIIGSRSQKDELCQQLFVVVKASESAQQDLQGIGRLKLAPSLEREKDSPAELEATMGKGEVFFRVVVQKTKCRVVVSRVLP
jgi:hypothetical protein